MLYLLKENNLLAEVLDFAEVLKDNKDASDIAHYYISETLLNTPLKEGQSYVDTLQKYCPQEGSSPGQITAMAKAMFLDKGPKAATDFLKGKMDFCKSQNEARQEFLVNLYDGMFPAGEENEPSFEEFSKSYLKGTALASNLAKEALVAGKL